MTAHDPTPSGDLTLTLTGVESKALVGKLVAWKSATFAPGWFRDALEEAKGGNSRDARRREILFAVAALESYLFEWARDAVLKGDHSRLTDYFPPDDRAPLADKWKDVPKRLKADGLIQGTPDLGGTLWRDFKESLVEYRNGLLHARTSRPERDGLPDNQLPKPSMRELDEMSPGWAVGVARRLIEELNTAAHTSPAEWLK